TSGGPDQVVGVGEGSRLDAEANQVVTNRTSPVSSDAIAHFWVITEGDPPGPLSFEVAIEGVPVRTLDMNLQAPSLPESF
ncbi:MAG: hypothetical protein ACN4GT_13460, partial [Gammaproteobacteria bacterium]